MKQKREYATEALKLVKAIDIAIESIKKCPPRDFTEDNINHVLNLHLEWKNSLLNPAPQYKNLASLKYKIADVFTYFQESNGEDVEYFWKKVNEADLGYLREDKLRKVVGRGRIKGRIEYDLVVDLIVVAEQEGRITAEESVLLSNMIGEFENRKRK